MINDRLFDEFVGRVKSKNILESGLSSKLLSILHSKFNIESFSANSSRFAMIPDGFKSTAMVRLPYADGQFGGFVSKYILGDVGNREYFMKELMRVSIGPLLMVEPSLDSFPRDYFSESEDIYVYAAAVNGMYHDVGQSWAELLTRRDLRRIFYNPGGSLNKFNTMVPEDIKIEVGVLFEQNGVKHA